MVNATLPSASRCLCKMTLGVSFWASRLMVSADVCESGIYLGAVGIQTYVSD